MKKSKFLQSSKDMIHRSFNPTKCKTSLRLAASRLKLLRNKKDVQVKQMKREIAQLLESGQDQTARIRVEHVIREEKMMAAYDLLEIYCELTIARLPIIESQKNCPIDLKEAIASIVFASPRCGDVPELLDARKQFSAKYGKEFISAAIELRPQCGVSRLLVEKLSATAPDGQTKNKILSAIAEEHNVTWEPKSFEEKHSGGSSSIKEGNELYSEPPHFEVAELQAHPGSNVNSSPLNSVQQNTEVSMGADNLPPVAVIPSGASTTPNVAYAGEEMPKLSQGDAHNNHLDGRRWKMEFKDAASAAQAAAESAEQASMAARAAAELSSHGRILGRYSAESYNPDAYTIKDYGLETPSNSNSYERSSENKASSEYTRLGKEKIDGRKPNKPTTPTRSEIGDYGGSEEYSQAVPLKSKSSADDDSLYHGVPLVHEHTREKPLKDVSEGEMVDNYNYKTANETGWPEKVEDLGEATVGKQKGFSSSYPQSGTPEYSLAVPVKSKASVDDDSLYRGVPSVMEYTRVNISKDPSEGDIVDNYGYKTASETDWPEKIEDLGEQKSFSSSYTQSGISDYVNIFAKSEEQKFENNTGEDPSMSIMTGIHDKTPDTVSHDFGAVTFDQSDTDSDGLELDSGPLYDEQDLEFHLHSSGRVSPERTSMNTGSWSPKSNSNNVVESASLPLYFTRENSFPDITENTTPKEDSELDNIPAARFDDSEGSSSESDEDEYSSRIEDHRNVFHEQNERSRFVHLHEETAESVGSPSKNEGSLAFGSKQYSLSSDDELNSSEGIWKRSQGNAFDVDSLEKLDHVKPSAGKPALGSKDSDIELNDSGNESGPETLEGLSFGRLTGGFRHKGHKHLPFFKNQLDASSVKEETATPSTVASSTDPSRDERPKIGTTSTAQSLHSELHSDSSEDEEDGYLQKSFGPKQPLSAGTMKTKSTPGFSNSIFDSDDSDLDENTPREPVTRKSHLRSGISRRTKAYPSSTANSNSKIHLRSEAPDSDSIDKNPTTAYSKGTSKERESSRRNSGTQEKYEQQPISGDISVPAQSNTQGSTEQLDSSKATPVKRKEPKERSNYGVYDSDNILGKQPSNMYAPDNREEVEASSRKSNHLGKSEQQKPAEVAAKPASSSSWETSEKPKSGKATSNDVQKSKISQKSSSVEDTGNPREKSGADASSGSGASTVDKPKPSLDKVDSTKKASHVHPKLPDYDSLVQSLRMNRS